MESIRAYVLSVTATAALCSLATRIVGQKGTSAGVIRMICGMIMACAVIRPLGTITIPRLSEYWDDLDRQVWAVVASGEEQTDDLIRGRITEATVTYVQDKASTLGASLSIQVVLDDHHVPVQIELTGEISPSAKLELGQIIQNDIGIRKEDQIWK